MRANERYIADFTNHHPVSTNWIEIAFANRLKVKHYQHFHNTVRIVLYIGCSGPVVGSLTATYYFYSDARLLSQNTQYTELCVQYEKLE